MTLSNLAVAVVGAGYVGIATAIGLADNGHQVTLVEREFARVGTLAAGKVPFHEPGLAEAYAAHHAAGRIAPATTTPAEGLDIVVVAVGTPINDAGSTDVTFVQQALDEASPALQAGACCVIRSTLPVGAANRLASRPGIVKHQFFVAPEFLRQGTALADIRHPSRVIIGWIGEQPDQAAMALVQLALAPEGSTLLIMRAEEASLVKNASNVFLALRLTFANEVAGLAEDLGVDVDPVLEGIGHDPRIGRLYMRPSFGFGGSCLPKEVRSFSSEGLDRGLPMHLAGVISSANDDHQRRFARKIADAVGGLSGRRIALLGLAFKADTDDVRYSPALRLAARLLASGAEVRAHDPEAGPNAKRALPDLTVVESAEEALSGADVAVIATEWPIYRHLDWETLRGTMKSPVIVDGRRLLPADRMRALGFTFKQIGDGVH